MTAAPTTLLVIAKRPLAGRVKTRLVPPLTFEAAADVAAAALSDTLAAVDSVDARHVLAFDGSPEGWCPNGWQVTPQPSGDLDVRLVSAFEAAGDGPALLVGMDTPQVTAAHLRAFDSSRFDACLGFARDGGYWAIGLRDPRLARAAITDIPMSTDHTGAAQLARLTSMGLRVQLLDELTDVDTIDTAREVAADAPDTLFAAALRRHDIPGRIRSPRRSPLVPVGVTV